MSNSAHTLVEKPYNSEVGRIGTKESRRCLVTFGADYASAVLPKITAAELGLEVVHAVIPEGTASTGAAVKVAKSTLGDSFTLALFNGTTAIGTVDESATTIELLILGN